LLVACPRMPAPTYATNTRTNGWRALDTLTAQTLAGADARIDRNVLPRVGGGDTDAPTGWNSGKVRVTIRVCILYRSCPLVTLSCTTKPISFQHLAVPKSHGISERLRRRAAAVRSIRLRQTFYVAGFQRIVRFRWPPPHGTQSANPSVSARAFGTFRRVRTDHQGPLADVGLTARPVAGTARAPQPPLLPKVTIGDHIVTSGRGRVGVPRTHAGTRIRGFTDDHEVSDEGIRLSVVRRRE